MKKKAKKESKVLNFRVLIEQDEDGVFVASVPAIPGCHSEGNTYEEAIKNIKEAIELCLEVAKEDSSYKAQIDFGQGQRKTQRLLGIIELPIRLGFSL